MTPTTRKLAGMAVLALLASCSPGASDSASPGGDRPGPGQPAGGGAATEGAQPAEEAPEGLSPLAPPDGFTEVSGPGYTVHAPAGFATERRTSSNGEPMLVLTADAPPGEAGAGGSSSPTVGVVREVRPRAGALEQSLTLESAKRLVSEATGVRRTVVAWPGTREAVLIEWTVQEREPGSAASAQAVRNVQLMAQVDDELILSVVAVAPSGSFDASQVATVLRTFRPTAVAS